MSKTETLGRNVNAPPRPRGSAARAAGLAISAVALVAVVWWASRQPTPTFPSTPTELWALAGAVAVYAVATSLRSERWLALLRHGSAQASRSDAYALTLVGYMGNNVLPLRAGDVMRVYLMAPRARTTMRNVVGTLIAERLLDVFVLLAMFFILAYGVLRGIDAPSEAALGGAAAVVLGAALVVVVLLLVANRTGRGQGLIDFLRPLATATRELRGAYGAAMVGLTLAIWVAEAGTYLFVGESVGLEISAIQALYLIALASVFLLIPSGPGYAGTLDAAVLFGVRAIGGSGSEAVSFLIMLRFVLLVPITLAGLAALLLRYGGLSAWRSAQAEAARL
jgi:uncharacterized membrane protein YbhN (UPF0104 family)